VPSPALRLDARYLQHLRGLAASPCRQQAPAGSAPTLAAGVAQAAGVLRLCTLPGAPGNQPWPFTGQLRNGES